MRCCGRRPTATAQDRVRDLILQAYDDMQSQVAVAS